MIDRVERHELVAVDPKEHPPDRPRDFAKEHERLCYRAAAMAVAEDVPPAREDGPAGRRISIAMVAIAILFAAFTGFRMPSRWCATLDAVSLFDGFHRRFFVGTVLRPLALATDFDYWLFAGFAFAVLLALLAVLIVAAARAELLTQRVLVIAWLLLPTGGFLFHDVGYLEQLLYLLVFAAIGLLRRNRLVAAAAVMCVTPWIHEIAVLTVIPVFGLIALRTLPFRRALAVTVPAAVLNAIVLLFSPASVEVVERMTATLSRANFVARPDALALFTWTLSNHHQKYNVYAQLIAVRPVAIALVGAFVALWLADRTLRRAAGPVPAVVVLLASCVAIAAPGLAILGGWDGNRWLFLIMANFFIVVWFALDNRGARELGRGALMILATALLVLSHFSIYYFDDYAPRELGSRPDRKLFLRQVFDHSLFAMPTGA